MRAVKICVFLTALLSSRRIRWKPNHLIFIVILFPSDSQLILRGRFLKRREGLIVRVACSRDSWGEIAPLPGFSEETIEQAQEQAIEWLTNWCHASCEAPRVPLDGCYPSVAFGISTAMDEMNVI